MLEARVFRHVSLHIQFQETMDIIHERQYIDRIAAMVPYSNKDTAEKMKLLCQMLKEYEPKGSAV